MIVLSLRITIVIISKDSHRMNPMKFFHKKKDKKLKTERIVTLMKSILTIVVRVAKRSHDQPGGQNMSLDASRTKTKKTKLNRRILLS